MFWHRLKSLRRPITLLNPDVTFATTKRRDLMYQIHIFNSSFNGATKMYRIDFDQDMRIVDTLNINRASVNALEDNLFSYRERGNALKFNSSVYSFLKVVEDVWRHRISIFTLVVILNSSFEIIRSLGKTWLLCFHLDPLRATSYHWLLEWIIESMLFVTLTPEG